MATTLEAPAVGIEMPPEGVLDISSMGEGLKLKDRRAFELTTDHAADFLDYPEFIVNDEKVASKFSPEEDGQRIWRRVRSVVATPFSGKVFNIGVEIDNSYVAEGIGVHNCWARLVADEEGLDPKTRCPVQLLKYEAQTIEDMRRLYASLDRGKARSAGVVLNSYLAGTDEFPGLPRSALRFMAQGLGVWLWPEAATRTLHKSDDRAYLLMKDYHKVALQVAKIVQECQSTRWLRRAPTVAAMFATSHKAPAIAYEFWRDVRDGVGITEKDDPRHVLRDWLMQASLAKSAHNGDLQTVSQEECYRACIYRWNDYRKGRKVKRMKLDMSLPRPEAQ